MGANSTCKSFLRLRLARPGCRLAGTCVKSRSATCNGSDPGIVPPASLGRRKLAGQAELTTSPPPQARVCPVPGTHTDILLHALFCIIVLNPFTGGLVDAA